MNLFKFPSKDIGIGIVISFVPLHYINYSTYIFRPNSPASRPSSTASSPSGTPLCPRCFRPLDAAFSNFDTAPFHEYSYLLMCRNMAKCEEMEKIAAKFGIRGNSFQPERRPSKATIMHPGSYSSYSGSATPVRQTNISEGAIRTASGRILVRETSGRTKGERDIAKGISKNRQDNYGEKIPKCTCTQQFMYDKTSLVDPNGVSSAHFVDFNHTPPVPVYISPKFMMQNPRERKQLSPRSSYSPLPSSARDIRLLPGRKHPKVPPINSKGGAVYINKSPTTHQTSDTPCETNKTTMDIYLPRLSQESDDESVQVGNKPIRHYNEEDCDDRESIYIESKEDGATLTNTESQDESD